MAWWQAMPRRSAGRSRRRAGPLSISASRFPSRQSASGPARYTWASQFISVLDPALVLARLGVYLDLLALAQKGGDHDLEPGLESGRLLLRGGRRALDAGVGL